MLVTQTTTTQPSARELFGANVRTLREAAGWTQAYIASELQLRGYQLHPSAVAKIEAGSRPTPVDEAIALADIFGVEPGILLSSISSKIISDAENTGAIRKLVAQYETDALSILTHFEQLKEDQANLRTISDHVFHGDLRLPDDLVRRIHYALDAWDCDKVVFNDWAPF